METIEYSKKLQWVGHFLCKKCSKTTFAWRSSGMSDLCPHFYCDRCSNVIRRAGDRDLLYRSSDTKYEELLSQIAATLPPCPCGGQFKPGTNPKCQHCNEDFPHSGSPVQRLLDPHMIVVDGACELVDGAAPRRVRIVD